MSQTEVQLIKDSAVVTADIADQAVTLDKLPHGTSSNNGKFLRANNGADPTFETISTDLLGDTSPQLGGDLDTNSFEINLDDAHAVNFGDSQDAEIKHTGSNFVIRNTEGNIRIEPKNGELGIQLTPDGGVSVYHDNSKKFETTSGGATLTGTLLPGANNTYSLGSSSASWAGIHFGDHAEIRIGNATGGDLKLFHNAQDSFIRNSTGVLKIQTGTENAITATLNGAVELYHDNSKKFETTSIGARIPDDQYLGFGDSDDLNIRFLNGTGAQIQSGGNSMFIRSNLIELGDNSGHKYIKCIDAGAVELYHGVDSKKLETTSSGISVTGAVYSSTGVFGEGTANNIDFTTDNRMGIHINGSEEFRFEADGDFHADGDVIAFSTTIASDENLKDNITTITDAVTKVEAIKGVTYTWKKDNSQSAGVIAQDVQKVLPEVVKTVSNFDGNEYLAVNYGGLTSILIEAIKDLSARVKVLEAK